MNQIFHHPRMDNIEGPGFPGFPDFLYRHDLT